MNLVLDASVIVRALSISEEGSSKAYMILRSFIDGEIDIFLPNIWFFEVGNVVKRKYKQYLDPLTNFLFELKFQEQGFDVQEREKILGLSIQHDCSYYDMSYLFLATKLNVALITADKRFFNNIKKSKSFKKEQLFLLEDFEI